MAKLRRHIQKPEQCLALLARRDRRAGASDGQNTVLQAGLIQAIRQVTTKIAVADGLACCQGAIAKQQKRLAGLQAVHLPGQRLEIGGGADDGINQPRVDKGALEGEFGVLKSKLRVLHANRRQQHHLADTQLLRRCQNIQMRLMVNRAGIQRGTRARRKA